MAQPLKRIVLKFYKFFIQVQLIYNVSSISTVLFKSTSALQSINATSRYQKKPQKNKKTKAYIYKKICTRVSTAASVITAKKCKQFKCTSIIERTNCGIFMQWNTTQQ